MNYRAEKYLKNIDKKAINMERVESVDSLSGDETLEYVMRTLDILDNCQDLTLSQYENLKAALEWCETGKSEELPFPKTGIHNLDSAALYRYYYETNGIVPLLIECHGLIGQAIRGEVSLQKYLPKLVSIADYLIPLSYCVIGGVSMELWDLVKDKAYSIVRSIKDGDYRDYSILDRITKLKPGFEPACIIPVEVEEMLSLYDFWYVEGTLNSFSNEEFVKIMSMVSGFLETNAQITDISFKKIMDDLYYDYRGKKYINVYKKRIIENFLHGENSDHVSFSFVKENRVGYPVFIFTDVCKSLIGFCVQAERSGILTYEKSITLLFDMFGFRKDKFDRLNNEHSYLDTMNHMTTSTKSTIPNYATGEIIVDVGSGGGAMLLALEEKFPDKTIIGTDISSEVLLNLSHLQDTHHFQVKKHNFVESPLDLKVDTIIFSSILHEIFSYTELDGKKFNIDSVKLALKNAYDSLLPGGRIIIRDGIRCGTAPAKLKLKTKEALECLENYRKDFKGLTDIPDDAIILKRRDGAMNAPLDYIREFLFTLTWGSDSYPHEVQEQFGYFTLKEYQDFLSSVGAKILQADEYLESGYVDHLAPYIELFDSDDQPLAIPNSTCFIVAEKAR
ncbi:MAG: methyltransferase [Clostridia bacterium]|nr:methyltransferase [Clostridia bacterium]